MYIKMPQGKSGALNKYSDGLQSSSSSSAGSGLDLQTQ